MDYNTLSAHGISPDTVASFEEVSDANETLLFVKLIASQRKCPYCGFEKTKLKEYKEKRVRSLDSGKFSTIIVYSLPRYKCPKCDKTYTHSLKETAANSISSCLKDKLMEKFATVCSFKSLAKDYHLSLTEVINIFDESCPDLKIPMTEAFCIDEFSNIRKDVFKYACILIDFSSHKIIDILPSRTTPYLNQYFDKLPLKVRNNVKYIITDMYDGYISAAKRWFHNAVIAIDPFHYMEYLTEAIQEMRRRILNHPDKVYSDASWMGKHWRLLSTNPDNYPKGKMTLKNGMTISYYDRVLRFVSQNNELHYAFLFIRNIFVAMNHLSFKHAGSFFESTINTLLHSSSPELVACGNTWFHYKDYIINSFIVFKGKRLSNGPVEGTNKRVKELKHVMAGYRNSSRFYKRFILITNSNKKG